MKGSYYIQKYTKEGLEKGREYFPARQYDQQLAQCRKTLEIDPNFWVAYWCLGTAYREKGTYEEAITEFQRAVDLSGGSSIAVAGLGLAYGLSGKRVEAQKVFDLLKEKAKQEYISPLAFVWFYIALDDKDQAFRWLEKAYEERHSLLIFLKVAPLYDPLRTDPRYTELLKKIGLPTE